MQHKLNPADLAAPLYSSETGGLLAGFVHVFSPLASDMDVCESVEPDGLVTPKAEFAEDESGENRNDRPCATISHTDEEQEPQSVESKSEEGSKVMTKPAMAT